MSHLLEQQLKEIMEFMVKQTLANKEIMSLSEAAIYMNVSKSFLYKKTFGKEITFYKPGTKIIFFRKMDLDAWMLSDKRPSIHELSTIPNPRKKGGEPMNR
jgi:excisionase family DNA binding protein